MPSETGLDSAYSRFECCRMVADLREKKIQLNSMILSNDNWHNSDQTKTKPMKPK